MSGTYEMFVECLNMMEVRLSEYHFDPKIHYRIGRERHTYLDIRVFYFVFVKCNGICFKLVLGTLYCVNGNEKTFPQLVAWELTTFRRDGMRNMEQ